MRRYYNCKKARVYESQSQKNLKMYLLGQKHDALKGAICQKFYLPGSRQLPLLPKGSFSAFESYASSFVLAFQGPSQWSGFSGKVGRILGQEVTLESGRRRRYEGSTLYPTDVFGGRANALCTF